MGKLVNYGKRSVQLPDGCKDLIDVLQEKNEPEEFHEKLLACGFKATRQEQATIRIAALQSCISDFLASTASLRSLLIGIPSKRMSIELRISEQQLALQICAIQSEHDTAIREFLIQHALRSEQHSSGPMHFISGTPTWTIHSVISPPSGLALANIIELIVRDIAGATENSDFTVYRADMERVP